MRSYSRPLISLSTTLCCEKKKKKKKKLLRRHPVVLKETRNRADTKVSVTVEPECIPPSFKDEKSGDVRQPFIHFPIKVNLK